VKRTLEDFIGETPLVRLQRLPGEDSRRNGNVILAKLLFLGHDVVPSKSRGG
jgi:hypothetical protein